MYLCSINRVKAAVSHTAVQCGLSCEVISILFDSIDKVQPTTLCYPMPMKDFPKTDATTPSPVPEFRSAAPNVSQDGTLVSPRVKPCRRFLRRGRCKFGDQCYFTHSEGTVYHNMTSEVESSGASSGSEYAAINELDFGVPADHSCDDVDLVGPSEIAGKTLISDVEVEHSADTDDAITCKVACDIAADESTLIEADGKHPDIGEDVKDECVEASLHKSVILETGLLTEAPADASSLHHSTVGIQTCDPIELARADLQCLDALNGSWRRVAKQTVIHVGDVVRVADPILSGDAVPVQLVQGDIGTVMKFDSDNDMFVYFPRLANKGIKGPKYEAIIFGLEFVKLEKLKT